MTKFCLFCEKQVPVEKVAVGWKTPVSEGVLCTDCHNKLKQPPIPWADQIRMEHGVSTEAVGVKLNKELNGKWIDSKVKF